MITETIAGQTKTYHHNQGEEVGVAFEGREEITGVPAGRETGTIMAVEWEVVVVEGGQTTTGRTMAAMRGGWITAKEGDSEATAKRGTYTYILMGNESSTETNGHATLLRGGLRLSSPQTSTHLLPFLSYSTK